MPQSKSLPHPKTNSIVITPCQAFQEIKIIQQQARIVSKYFAELCRNLSCQSRKNKLIPVLWFTKSNIFGPSDVKIKLRMGAQAATDSCLFLCYFEAIRQLPLGDFGAITFSSPAFTMMLSIFLLNPVEKKTDAVVLAVLSAWVTILARQVNHIHFSVQILWFSLSGVIISLLGKFMIDTTTSRFPGLLATFVYFNRVDYSKILKYVG